MCKILDDMREEVTQYVTKKVSWETKAESVRRWHEMGIPLDTIAQGGLSMEQVKGILSPNQL